MNKHYRRPCLLIISVWGAAASLWQQCLLFWLSYCQPVWHTSNDAWGWGELLFLILLLLVSPHRWSRQLLPVPLKIVCQCCKFFLGDSFPNAVVECFISLLGATMNELSKQLIWGEPSENGLYDIAYVTRKAMLVGFCYVSLVAGTPFWAVSDSQFYDLIYVICPSLIQCWYFLILQIQNGLEFFFICSLVSLPLPLIPITFFSPLVLFAMAKFSCFPCLSMVKIFALLSLTRFIKEVCLFFSECDQYILVTQYWWNRRLSCHILSYKLCCYHHLNIVCTEDRMCRHYAERLMMHLQLPLLQLTSQTVPWLDIVEFYVIVRQLFARSAKCCEWFCV